jgi:hypothetical protein
MLHYSFTKSAFANLQGTIYSHHPNTKYAMRSISVACLLAGLGLNNAFIPPIPVSSISSLRPSKTQMEMSVPPGELIYEIVCAGKEKPRVVWGGLETL